MAKRKPSKNGQNVPQSALQRSDPVPCLPASCVQQSAPSAPTRSELKPYIPSLCAPPYGIDDDDREHGIYGVPEFRVAWTGDDADGVPIIADFVRRSYDWQIECWERECRQMLAKYGCGIDPRDPIPGPLPDEATEMERDAYRLVRAVGALKKRFRTGDYSAAIISAIELGSLKRKIQSRWADKLVDRGVKHARTTKQMKATREEKYGHPAENRASALAQFNLLRNQHPKWTKDRIVRQISKSLRLSERQIWRLLPATKRKKI